MLCEKNCRREALHGERFCEGCRRFLLAEMQDSGYLTPRIYGHEDKYRPPEAKENTRDTKYGRD